MKYRRHVAQDLFVLAASVAVAVGIVRFGLVDVFVVWAGDSVGWASFVAGMFFTSMLTTAPAIAVLGELTQEGNLFVVAALGAAGAVVGDYILFAFVRDRISEDVAHFLSRSTLGRLHAIFRRPTFKWVLPFVGGLIIASPLPDELGLALLGAAKLPTRYFVPLSFAFNAAGIIVIGLVANSL